jgi:twitching motility two-component system response regulator PilG
MMQKVHWTNGTDHPTTNVGTWPGEFSCQQQSGFLTGADAPSLGVAHKLFIAAIDVSPTVRKIMETCLSREGYAVKGFSDGVEAMSGYDIVRTIKARPQFDQTVIVMVSCHGGVIDWLKGRLVGVKAFIIKPFKTQNIVSVVALHLGMPA